MKNSDIREYISEGINVWFNNQGGEKTHNPHSNSVGCVKGSIWINFNCYIIETSRNESKVTKAHRKLKGFNDMVDALKKEGCKFYIK